MAAPQVESIHNLCREKDVKDRTGDETEGTLGPEIQSEQDHLTIIILGVAVTCLSAIGMMSSCGSAEAQNS